MEFKIIQTIDFIKVLLKEEEILYVKTSLNWLGVFKLKFYIKEELILYSTCSFLGFRRFVKIKYIKKDIEFKIIRINCKRYLKRNENIYGLVWKYFGDIQNVITKNDEPLASLYIKKTLFNWYLSNPEEREFTLTLKEEAKNDYFYFLIRTLLEFPYINL